MGWSEQPRCLVLGLQASLLGAAMQSGQSCDRFFVAPLRNCATAKILCRIIALREAHPTLRAVPADSSSNGPTWSFHTAHCCDAISICWSTGAMQRRRHDRSCSHNTSPFSGDCRHTAQSQPVHEHPLRYIYRCYGHVLARNLSSYIGTTFCSAQPGSPTSSVLAAVRWVGSTRECWSSMGKCWCISSSRAS